MRRPFSDPAGRRFVGTDQFCAIARKTIALKRKKAEVENDVVFVGVQHGAVDQRIARSIDLRRQPPERSGARRRRFLTRVVQNRTFDAGCPDAAVHVDQRTAVEFERRQSAVQTEAFALELGQIVGGQRIGCESNDALFSEQVQALRLIELHVVDRFRSQYRFRRLRTREIVIEIDPSNAVAIGDP